MKTDNELIAEFYNGITFDEKGFCTDQTQKYSWRPAVYDPLEVRHLAYHNNWNWLMPVVKKITPIARGSEGEQFRNVAWADVSGPLTRGDIEGVYTYVVDFIKRYNSQNHKP